MNESCLLTRIFSPAPEICPKVLLAGDVFYTERVFLCRQGPTEHMVILGLSSVLSVNLLPARYS